MVDDRESPSSGWREVYREMDADTRIEEPTRPCPDCGRTCEHLVREVYECEEHGVFRASAEDASSGDEAGSSTESGEAADERSPQNAAKRDRPESGESDSPDLDDETSRARGPV